MHQQASREPGAQAQAVSLREVLPGRWARVLRIEGVPPALRERLQAYGLAEGQPVRVVQHAPVTVVQVDNTELAFEAELAHGVRVQALV